MFSSSIALRLLVCFSIVLILVILPVRSDSRHCGASLTNAMNFLCQGQFQTYGKRSGEPSIIDPKGGNTDIDTSYITDNFQLHPRFARSPTNQLPWYIKNDIVQACCDNPCGVNKMLSYCKRD